MKDVFEWTGKMTICVLLYVVTRVICDFAGVRETWSIQTSTILLMVVGYEIGFFKKFKDYI